MTTLPASLRRRLWRRHGRLHGEPATPDQAVRGQALVEFAIGLPVMLLIMLGTLDIGQAFIDFVALRNACREGASYAARNPTDYVAIETRVFEHSPIIDDGQTDIDVEYPDGTVFDPQDANGMKIAVRGTREFTPIMLGFFQTFDSDFGSFQLETVATAEILK